MLHPSSSPSVPNRGAAGAIIAWRPRTHASKRTNNYQGGSQSRAPPGYPPGACRHMV